MDNKKLFIANWKSNKTSQEAVEWLKIFKDNLVKINLEDKEIIVCPSFIALSSCYSFIKENNLPIKLGVQNISKFGDGPYTGEVNVRQAKEYVEYVLIGHSERRKYFFETDQDIEEKTRLAKEIGLKTIICVQNENTNIPQLSEIVAYEPESAIGTGNPEDPQNVADIVSNIHSRTGKDIFLYGGSVNEENAQSFLEAPMISGLLVGTASLDPYTYIKLLL
ncbi:triosephosphate isomerase [Candidatus Parcubacteria bacterium]|nr:MAG: triosephosphate isomerase [Candidatus Parcubacteria bacterium]